MQSKQELCAAIVGCGSIAETHAKAVLQSKLGRLTAFVDVNLEKANQLAQKYNGLAYEDFEEMLQQAKPDVVHICTPHYVHAEMVLKAAKNETAVFTEKPPAINAKQMEKILQAASFAPVGVCFQNRFNPSVEAVLKMQQQGLLGKVTGARAFVTWCREAEYYGAAPWRGLIEQAGGGSLMNQSIHTLDLLVLFLGRPRVVKASMANRHLQDVVEVEDTVEALLQFQDASALFYSSNSYCCDERVFLEFCFENATVRMEEAEVELRWKDGRCQREVFSANGLAEKSYWGAGHSACVKSFYEGLLDGSEFAITPQKVQNTMDTVFGVYQSAKENKTIYL